MLENIFFITNLKLKHVFIILTLCSCNICVSQVKNQKKDSTTNIYTKFEDFSKKSKFTKLVHKLIFKSPNRHKNETTTKIKELEKYALFEGKIIREIIVESHDPFGFSFNNPNRKPKKWIERFGNNLHLKSKKFTIKNYIIFKKNQPFDSLKIIESERLIRSQRFIRDVEITVKSIEKSKDSVDVYITSLDSWSLAPDGSVSESSFSLRLNQKNFLGYGHELKIGGRKEFGDNKTSTNMFYRVPNFKNTYINTTVSYNKDINDFYNKRINIRRPFFSPYTKWAAGIYVDEQFSTTTLESNNSETSNQNYKYQSKDIWAGYSIKLFKGNTETERNTRVIAAARLLNINYLQKPEKEFDSINFFSNENFYLASIGISSRKYIEDSFIFRDGITENIPIGNTIAFTIGNRHKNKQNKLYLGGEFSYGNHYNWGYLSTHFKYETFFKQSTTTLTAYTFSANYFTHLISLGSQWKMRQFIKPQLLIGKHRLDFDGDRVTIDDSNNFQSFYGNEEQLGNRIKIPGFNSGLIGTSKFVLSAQTQFYTPWDFIGFRCNPYININIALLGNEENSLLTSKVYSSFGLGVVIRNNYLVFSSIKLSLIYYPEIPGSGNDVYKTNVISNDDFRLQDFNLGKPSTIWYN